MADYTLPELFGVLKEVGREIGYRKYCYPKWIANGRLDPAKADTQLKNLEKGYAILKSLYEKGVANA